MRRLRDLAGDVEKGAAAKRGALHALDLRVEEREQLAARVEPGPGETGADRRPRVGRVPRQACGDEVVLRLVVRVERRLGDAGLVYHPLDADRMHALAVEEVGCR